MVQVSHSLPAAFLELGRNFLSMAVIEQSGDSRKVNKRAWKGVSVKDQMVAA